MKTITVPVLENLDGGASSFSEENYPLDDFNGMFISPRQEALNFRHRTSEPGYTSDWHVAGDPTLILVRQGTLRIGLRDGSYFDFSAGDLFIARDHVQGEFDPSIHGHTAEVIGNDPLLALHLKLSQK